MGSEGVKQVLSFDATNKNVDPRKILKDIKKLKEKFVQLHYAGARQSEKNFKQRETQHTDKKNYGMYDPSLEPKKLLSPKDRSILAIGEKQVVSKPQGIKVVQT